MIEGHNINFHVYNKDNAKIMVHKNSKISLANKSSLLNKLKVSHRKIYVGYGDECLRDQFLTIIVILY